MDLPDYQYATNFLTPRRTRQYNGALTNAPWYALRDAIRYPPEEIISWISDDHEFYLDRRDVVVTVGGKEILRHPIERNRVIEERDYPESVVQEAINAYLDQRFAAVDWSSYFDPPGEPKPTSKFMTTDEIREALKDPNHVWEL